MISFIIPAHNEEHWLGPTLGALHAAAAGQPYEILVVADACTDRTAECARAHGARVIDVRYRHIAAARNAGARAAGGEVFFFIDADTQANPAAIRAGLRALGNGAVGGGFVFRFDGGLPLWVKLIYPVGVVGQRLLKLAGGCFLFCTCEAYRAAGGFCEQYYAGEEIVFIGALKKRGRFVVPPGYVTTSGRKVRSLSNRQAIDLLVRMVVGGPEAFQRRDGLEVWYGERRPDPERAGPSVGQGWVEGVYSSS